MERNHTRSLIFAYYSHNFHILGINGKLTVILDCDLGIVERIVECMVLDEGIIRYFFCVGFHA